MMVRRGVVEESGGGGTGRSSGVSGEGSASSPSCTPPARTNTGCKPADPQRRPRRRRPHESRSCDAAVDHPRRLAGRHRLPVRRGRLVGGHHQHDAVPSTRHAQLSGGHRPRHGRGCRCRPYRRYRRRCSATPRSRLVIAAAAAPVPIATPQTFSNAVTVPVAPPRRGHHDHLSRAGAQSRRRSPSRPPRRADTETGTACAGTATAGRSTRMTESAMQRADGVGVGAVVEPTGGWSKKEEARVRPGVAEVAVRVGGGGEGGWWR